MRHTPHPAGRRALVTGCAGFLGSHLSERLVDDGWQVVGVDCLTDYYPSEVKLRNLSRLLAEPAFRWHERDLAEVNLASLLDGVDTVFHLAAQAGVRGSFGKTFEAYVRDNVVVTQRLLEAVVRSDARAFVYASSSSVYGNAERRPTPESTPRSPVSPYGMTKVATEELAGVYSRVHGLPTVGLRYFTAYGPRQRPDMAFSLFISAALEGRPITVLGDGNQIRDFTFVDDVVSATMRSASVASAQAPVFNIGGGAPLTVNDVLGQLRELLGRPLAVRYADRRLGDARHTSADVTRAAEAFGFAPSTSTRDGLAAQLAWHQELARRLALAA